MVHEEVAAAFEGQLGQLGFDVEAGFLDGNSLKNGLRVAGSSFLDVLWNAAKRSFQDAQRIYILEVRP